MQPDSSGERSRDRIRLLGAALLLSWLLVGLSCGNALWNLFHLPNQTLERVAIALALPGVLATAGIPLWACGLILVLMVCLVIWCIVATRRGILPGTGARFAEHVRARNGTVVLVAPVVLIGAGVLTAALIRVIDHLTLPSSLGSVPSIVGSVLQDEVLASLVPLLLLAVALVLLIWRPRAASTTRPDGTRNAGTLPSFTGQYRLLSDTCRDADGKYQDLLGYESFAKTIAKTILVSKTPSLAIAIEAEAGVGKTTAMQLIKQELEADGQCHIVWFDAWKYPAADIQRAFLSTVVLAISPPAFRTYLEDRRKDVARTLVDVVGRAKQMGDVGTLIAGTFDFEARYRNQFEMDFKMILDYQMKSQSTKQLVVIFVDDLDRCAPKATSQVFEAMKLFSDTPGCVFVYGFNPVEVTRRIVLENKDYILDGRDHLSKFVQSSYSLPRPDPLTVKEFIGKQIEEAWLGGFFASDSLRGFEERMLRDTNSNPRKIKNVLNMLVLSLPSKPNKDHRRLFDLFLLQYRDPDAFQEYMSNGWAGAIYEERSSSNEHAAPDDDDPSDSSGEPAHPKEAEP